MIFESVAAKFHDLRYPMAVILNATLLPEATSWYLGANIPGKPRVFMVYLGGGKPYKEIITDSAAKGYAGFTFTKRVAPADQEQREAVAA